jgi:hypothetical protein
LTDGQLTELTARVGDVVGDLRSAGRPYTVGLFRSVAMVVALMRRNLVQDVARAFFGVSQPTVSRRWDLLRPVIAEVLDEFVPDPAQAIGAGSALVDGTICPTWDWAALPDLFSGKTRYSGFNVQIAADLDDRLVAVGTELVHGARHDAHAYDPSGLAARLAGLDTVGTAKSVVNVGAGTGSYEPSDRHVTAVDPSEVMIVQRPANAAPMVQAFAEQLPFPSRSFDAAMKRFKGLAARAEVDKLTGNYIAPSLGRITVAELGRKWLKGQVFDKESWQTRIESIWRVQVEPF